MTKTLLTERYAQAVAKGQGGASYLVANCTPAELKALDAIYGPEELITNAIKKAEGIKA